MGVAYAATGRCPSLSHPELVRRGDFGCYIGGALYVLYNPKDMAPAVGCWDGGKEPTGAKGRWCAYNEAVNWRRESGGGASVVPPEGSQVFVKSFPACDDDVLVAFTEVSRAFDWNDLPGACRLPRREWTATATRLSCEWTMTSKRSPT